MKKAKLQLLRDIYIKCTGCVAIELEDEKIVAGLFLIQTPGKFAKPFLKHADDAGGVLHGGRKASKPIEQKAPNYGMKSYLKDHIKK